MSRSVYLGTLLLLNPRLHFYSETFYCKVVGVSKLGRFKDKKLRLLAKGEPQALWQREPKAKWIVSSERVIGKGLTWTDIRVDTRRKQGSKLCSFCGSEYFMIGKKKLPFLGPESSSWCSKSNSPPPMEQKTGVRKDARGRNWCEAI